MSIRPRELPSGKKVWLVAYRDGTGARRFKQFPTKREAEDWRNQTGVDVKAGRHVADSQSLTVKEAAKLWLAHIDAREGRGELERNAVKSYRQCVNLRILHGEIGIGALRLNALSLAEVHAFRDRLLGHCSRGTARKTLTILKMMIDWQILTGRAMVNNAANVKVPRHREQRESEQVNVPSRETVKALLDKAPEDFRPLLVVACFSGLRASEIYGLRWQDVDFADQKIHVRQRAVDGKIGPPKSKAGRRSIPCGPYLINALKAWKLKSGGSDGLVFPTRTGKPLWNKNVAARRWKPLLKAVRADNRFHDLRHFAVSCWIEQGLSPKAVMVYAGHASITITFDRYGHLFPEDGHHGAMADAETKVLGL